jgi:23S rRNA (adenine2503-C2)-methyltransferase
MIQDCNDGAEHAGELSEKLTGMLCHVNLIPVNAAEGSVYKPSDRPHILQFQNILSKSGIQVTVRRSLGGDINASCGQLVNQNWKDQDERRWFAK